MHDSFGRGGRLRPIEWAAACRPLPGEEISAGRPVALDIDAGPALFGRTERVEAPVQLCPTGIAEHILGEHAKDTDGAMVLIARHRGSAR